MPTFSRCYVQILRATKIYEQNRKKLYYIYCSSRTIFFGVVSIAQLVEVKDSAVLGGVVEVLSSNPTVGHKIFFSIYRHTVKILKFGTPQTIAIIVLKLVKFDVTLH